MKRRSLTLVLCLLATLSLASVGFAAWVISAGDVESLTGNITVETVTDNRVFIEKLPANAGTVVFGVKKPAEDYSEPWLTNTTIGNESLNVTIYFNVENADKETLVKDTDVTVEAVMDLVGDDAEDTQFNALVSAGYIDAIPTCTIEYKAEGWETGKCYKLTASFVWGDLFNNQNPYQFYNAKGVHETFKVNATTGLPDGDGVEMSYGSHAAKFFQNCFEALEGKEFKITITATHKG